MKSYHGTKIIKAEKMTKKNFLAAYKGQVCINDEPGYLVRYRDGYTSWSPANVFEEAYKEIHGNLKNTETELSTSNYTIVGNDQNVFKAPHNYFIKDKKDTILAAIHFQEGYIKESGVNGVFMEDLLNICMHRLISFQESEFKCEQNEMAITYINMALKSLRARTKDRKTRGVLGTNKL